MTEAETKTNEKVELTEEQKAFNTVSHACRLYQGTLQDHLTLQQALEILKPKE